MMESYVLYEKARRSYQRMIMIRNNIAARKEELFSKTQPRSVRTDSPKVSGGSGVNATEKYVEILDAQQLDAQLKEADHLLRQREEYLLIPLQEELEKSWRLKDQIFFCKYIKGMKAEWISKKLGYSVSNIYRYLKEIQTELDQL